MLEPIHKVQLSSSHESANLAMFPDLDDLREYNRNAIAQAALRGDDYGNVTSYNPGGPASYYGMNRLNHCPPIFDESLRSGDARLRETAVQWCSNMNDLSLWWGNTPDFGGTRYNAAVAAGERRTKAIRVTSGARTGPRTSARRDSIPSSTPTKKPATRASRLRCKANSPT